MKTARVYLLGGNISGGQIDAVKKYVINPVESREASLARPATLAMLCAAPGKVEVLNGFCHLDENGLREFSAARGLAMDDDTLHSVSSTSGVRTATRPSLRF